MPSDAEHDVGRISPGTPTPRELDNDDDRQYTRRVQHDTRWQLDCASPHSLFDRLDVRRVIAKIAMGDVT
ncbi:hypothetical protein FFI94_015780 [Rhodococcus sp. KBS0724]|jgi:hypothetical protein|uniref:hypothetical protein n=1 Tax=Rhodococcus sp. KBS0724 TaxID=1179674 RepID=UPI00110F003A|nr:hypothetical protein [Rhodococcus sp. KBS0724]TSD47466.1 hypothetical protein FFI94_015780 [Rhodococcus sp. KBS0724]